MEYANIPKDTKTTMKATNNVIGGGGGEGGKLCIQIRYKGTT